MITLISGGDFYGLWRVIEGLTNRLRDWATLWRKVGTREWII